MICKWKINTEMNKSFEREKMVDGQFNVSVLLLVNAYEFSIYKFLTLDT